MRASLTLSCADGSDKLFNRVIIFHAQCPLDAAANVNGMWGDSCDGLADVLCVQTTGENKKSRERKSCSCRRPIAGQSRAAAQFHMVRIKEHVTIGKCADLLRLEPGVGAESSNDAKFASQFSAGCGREISVQLNRFDTRSFRGVANFVSTCVNKYADRPNAARQYFNNLPRSLRLDVARALRIKIESNHIGVEFDGS